MLPPAYLRTDITPAQAIDNLVVLARAAHEKRAINPLAAAGLGAAAGGLGGYALANTGERRRNPWTTALSGALAGGALGGGLALLPQLANAAEQPPAPADAAALKAEAVQHHRALPTPQRIADMRSPGAAGDSYGRALAAGAVRNPTITGAATAGGGYGWRRALNDRAAETARYFRAGTSHMPAGSTVSQGLTDLVNYEGSNDVRLGRTLAGELQGGRRLGNAAWLQRVPFNSPYRDEIHAAINAGKTHLSGTGYKPLGAGHTLARIGKWSGIAALLPLLLQGYQAAQPPP